MNNQLKTTSKDAKHGPADYAFEGLSLEAKSSRRIAPPTSQEDVLNQFDFSSLSLDSMEVTPAEANNTPETPATQTNTIDPGHGINTDGLGAFDLDKYGLVEKETGKLQQDQEKPQYTGPERRVNDRRESKDRRDQTRFDGSERRNTPDRRTSNASPWTKGYRL